MSGVDDSANIERPLQSGSGGYWGSDALAEIIRALDIPYVALNPGASFRGLHDSLVNHLGNEAPKLLLCLHEESAVAIAHGWAKVKHTPLLVIVHANVALLHATMAIFNAWVDRVPVVVIGSNGPRDARNGGPGSIGSTRPAIRAHWCGALRNGTTSRRPFPRHTSRSCAPAKSP